MAVTSKSVAANSCSISTASLMICSQTRAPGQQEDSMDGMNMNNEKNKDNNKDNKDKDNEDSTKKTKNAKNAKNAKNKDNRHTCSTVSSDGGFCSRPYNMLEKSVYSFSSRAI